MKPLNLSIQAFGPFAGLQKIDFTSLGQNPLFLINGPTGAGKSSILDAICFALYGKTTADERDASEMRCDQSSPELLTEVVLDFELAENCYRIKRSPAQDRPKARGEGVTKHQAEACLWSLDEEGKSNLIESKKVKQANQQIERITGLDVHQFRQVMVLPQGKFRDLLLADSIEREKIFGKLFQTQIYKRIEDQLYQQASEISREVTNLENQIKGILQSAELNAENEIGQQVDLLKPELKKTLKQKQQANAHLQNSLMEQKSSQQILKKFAQLENSKEKISELKLQQADVDAKQLVLDAAIKALKIKPQFDDLNRQKNQQQKIQQQLTESVRLKDEAEMLYIETGKSVEETGKAYKKVDSLKAEKQQIERYVDKINYLDDAKRCLFESELTESKSSAEYIAIQSNVTLITNDIGSQEKLLDDIRYETAELSNKKIEQSTLSQQFTHRQKLDELQNQLSTGTQNTARLANEFDALTEISDQSLVVAKKQEMLWHAGQAINLAKELEQDKPCPVCGSTSHPAPAVPDEDQMVVSKEQVDLARSQADLDQQQKQQALNMLNKNKIEQQQIEKEISELELQLVDHSELTNQQFKKMLVSLNAAVKGLDKKQSNAVQVNEKLIQQKSQLENLSEKLLLSRQQHEKDKHQLLKDKAAVEHLSGDLPGQYRLKVVVVEALQKLSASIADVTEQFENANSMHQQCLTRLTELKTTVQEKDGVNNELLSDIKVSAINWEKKLSSSIFDSEQSFDNALLAENKQTEIADQITAYNDLFKKFQNQLELQQKELKGKVEPDLTVINQTVSDGELDYRKAEEEWKLVDARVNQLNSVQRKLKHAHETNAELEARYAIYGTLSKVANGRTSNKISLQRFVLSVLLDDVLIQASQRLSVMSKGRYQLQRRQTSTDNRKVSGLELDIEDAYTGKTRSVATLSGGESFMAALSLALGLSDVVQAYAGGIKLDTLFIDEGFGSLDQESLDLAIRTLTDLQATGRMIGIISHVTELKEQMALRLDVMSSKTGSSVSIVST